MQQIAMFIKTMSSREIADLTEKRHDSVKRTIATLAESSVISYPQIVDGIKAANGVAEKLYLVNQRDSYVIVAQLSPEFTARLVDRWQALEASPAIAVPRRAAAIPSTHRAALAMVKPALAAAKAFGFTGNAAILSANRFISNATGVSPLALMGDGSLIADQRGQTFTPTQLGAERGISGQAMNKLLMQFDAQQRNRDGEWIPTTAGMAHAEWLDTAKAHHDGTPVKQLKWFATVTDLIEA